MKRLLSIILLSIMGIACISAQSNTNAQNILDKAAAKVQSAKGINISFSLTQKNNENQPITSSKGTLLIKGVKYYIKQGANEIFCNGEHVWNYDGGTEVTVAKVDIDDNELSPQQIITGVNKKEFDIKLASSSGTSYQVLLMPVDKRKNFKQVTLYINKTSNLITKAIITDKTNTITELSFSNILLNASIPDSRFVFETSKHPGVEVINQ